MHTEPQHKHLILFDGVCALCNGFVQFVLRRDREALFDFAPLQGDLGRRWTTAEQQDANSMTSMIVVREYRASPTPLERGEAAIFVVGALGWPWRIFSVLSYCPRFLTNLLYDAIASRRYLIAERTTTCFVPGPGIRERFVDSPLSRNADGTGN
jgi:predicted DCC family thiol-disulfide oxidoreductase YuxK